MTRGGVWSLLSAAPSAPKVTLAGGPRADASPAAAACPARRLCPRRAFQGCAASVRPALKAAQCVEDLVKGYRFRRSEQPSQGRRVLHRRGVRGPGRQDLAFLSVAEMRILHNIVGGREADRRAHAPRQRSAQALVLNRVFRGRQAHVDISSFVLPSTPPVGATTAIWRPLSILQADESVLPRSGAKPARPSCPRAEAKSGPRFASGSVRLDWTS